MNKIVLIALVVFGLGMNSFGAIVDFVVEHDNPAQRNYGCEVIFRFFGTNKKGVKKELSRKSMDNITFKTVNGDFSFYTPFGSSDLQGKLILMKRPQSIKDTLITIEFTYTEKETVFTKNFSFTLNYQGNINLDFSGKPGQPGKTFQSVGAAILSNASHDGEPGTAGTNGSDLEITMIQQAVYEDTFYVLNVNEVLTGMYYIYKIEKTFSKIFISSNGGEGGNGGSGTNGSRSNRFRVDGGNGGPGGTGGNAGKITFFMDDRAWRIMPKISLTNNPGYGGKGGTPGDGATHKDDSSIVGRRGNVGANGADGTKPNLAVPELKELH